MERQRRIHQPVYYEFPRDFPDRLEPFKEETGLTWNALARRLGVNPYRLREWRRGTIPDSTNLFILLSLADKLGLLGILMCPERDMGDEAEPRYIKRTTGYPVVNGQIPP